MCLWMRNLAKTCRTLVLANGIQERHSFASKTTTSTGHWATARRALAAAATPVGGPPRLGRVPDVSIRSRATRLPQVPS